MADSYGADALPATAALVLENKGDRAPDRALDAIGSYLQAVLPTRCGALWSRVAPNEQLVAEVFTSRPQDCLPNPSQFPALFLWRGRFTQQRESDDYLITRTQVGLQWLLWWQDPIKRERCLPFQGTVSKAIHESLARGRHPAWVVPGDTTPGAATRGSVLVEQAGLVAPLDTITGDVVDVMIGPKDAQPVAYKALSLTLLIAERMVRDPTLFSVPTISTSDPQNGNVGTGLEPAALDLTVAQSTTADFTGNTTEQLKPQP